MTSLYNLLGAPLYMNWSSLVPLDPAVIVKNQDNIDPNLLNSTFEGNNNVEINEGVCYW